MTKTIFLYIIILIPFSANSQSLYKFDIDSFFTYKDSVVYYQYDSVYKHFSNEMKLMEIDSIDYDCELFAFTWSGYTGFSHYLIYRFNENGGYYYVKRNYTKPGLAKITTKRKSRLFLKGTNLFNYVFEIESGYSLDWRQYVVFKWRDKIIFCRVSYGTSIYNLKKPINRLKKYIKKDR